MIKKGLVLDKLKEIIKYTLNELKRKNLDATPTNYFQEFCETSKLYNVKIDECNTFKNMLSSINYDEQEGITTPLLLSSHLINKYKHNTEGLEKLIKSLGDILIPSVNYEIEEEIETLVAELSKEPSKLLKRDTISQIKELTNKRVLYDRLIITNKTEDIIKLTSLMGKYFDKTLLTSDNSSAEINKIKKELEDLNISNASARELSILQSKLIETIYNIENSLEEYKIEISKGQEDFNKLEKTVIKLQKELHSAKEESSLDFLTNILNRRSFDKEIDKIEKKYNLFNSNYAVVFYDIDYFKSINDNYGHDCGDAVLRTFAGVLKRLTRKEDVICRWGGEEFVVLLNYDKEKEIIKYINRVKELVNNSNFNYKNNKISVKFSAGVAYRDKYENHFDTINKADEYLYIAKNSGRDKVVLENGVTI